MSLRIGLLRVGPRRVLRPPQLHSVQPLRFFSTTNDSQRYSPRWFMNELEFSHDKVQTIHTFLPRVQNLYSQTQSLVTNEPAFTEQEVCNILEILCVSGRPQDLQRVKDILLIFTSTFHLNLTSDIHTTIIRGLVKGGHRDPVLKWLRNMEQTPPYRSPTVEQYHILLQAGPRLGNWRFFRNLVGGMRNTGCPPTIETYKLLIQFVWDSHPEEEGGASVTMFMAIMTDMKTQRLPYDQTVADLIANKFKARGASESARHFVQRYQKLYGLTDEYGPVGPADIRSRWSPQIQDAAHKGGLDAAIAVYGDYRKAGGKPSRAIFSALLRHSTLLDDLKRVQQLLDMAPTLFHYSILINNNMRNLKTSQALAIYQAALDSGFVPDAPMVGPIIRGLCRLRPDPPREESLDKALDIYESLAKTYPPTSALSDEENDRGQGPDAEIYRNLIRGLSSSPNITKYTPSIQMLLKHMDERKLPTDDVLAYIVIVAMKSAKTEDEAFTVYRRFHSGLSESGYIKVLDTYCKLTFGYKTHIPSQSNYFRIVSDMRVAGHPITAPVYTIILNRIGETATQVRRSRDRDAPATIKQLTTITRRTHDLITLDASITPDNVLYNQLMNTYQRLGCLADCFRVWEQLYLSGQFDDVSVNVILDACGHSGSLPLAQQTRARLLRSGFQFNLHNWNTWVECLCRLGRLNDALKVVCLEIGQGHVDVAPNIDSVNILLAFTRKPEMREEILRRVQKYRPLLWASLPKSLTRRISAPRTKDEEQLPS